MHIFYKVKVSMCYSEKCNIVGSSSRRYGSKIFISIFMHNNFVGFIVYEEMKNTLLIKDMY